MAGVFTAVATDKGEQGGAIVARQVHDHVTTQTANVEQKFKKIAQVAFGPVIVKNDQAVDVRMVLDDGRCVPIDQKMNPCARHGLLQCVQQGGTRTVSPMCRIFITKIFLVRAVFHWMAAS